MEYFSIGLVSFILAIAFPVFYIVILQIRRLGSWSIREEGPRDRVGFFLIIATIFGFIVRSLAQPSWNKAVECRAAGQPVLPCVFTTK